MKALYLSEISSIKIVHSIEVLKDGEIERREKREKEEKKRDEEWKLTLEKLKKQHDSEIKKQLKSEGYLP